MSEDWCCVLGYDTILEKHSMSRVAEIFKVVKNLNTLVTHATTLFITCLRTPNLVFQNHSHAAYGPMHRARWST